MNCQLSMVNRQLLMGFEMGLSRRDFLRLGGVTAVAATATACGAAGYELERQAFPDELSVLPSASVVRRMLNRGGFGAAPGEAERVEAMGLAAYVEEQLHPEGVEDTAVDLLMRSFSFYDADITQLIEIEEKDALFDLVGSTFLRAVYSRRQLYEVMVEFWSDHFNIYVGKNKQMPMLKIVDDREVIRPHALGNFGDLLRASAKSAAMLTYLDNIENEKSAPNENYARELLELHTLGVNGGYTQQDVQELARVLTGWTVGKRGRHKGKVIFEAELHDVGEKVILERPFPAGQGKVELDGVLDLLIDHPSTAHFIATKLVRRFVADEPPAALVEQVAASFQATGGEIKPMLRLIFLSEAFAEAPPKLKRPFTYMVSLLRALSVDVRLGRGRELANWMRKLGQRPFYWPPPDGYPDMASAWVSNLLPRWNFALTVLHDELANSSVPLEKIESAAGTLNPLDRFAGLLYGRLLTPTEKSLFAPLGQEVHNHRTAAALLAAGPAFQWS